MATSISLSTDLDFGSRLLDPTIEKDTFIKVTDILVRWQETAQILCEKSKGTELSLQYKSATSVAKGLISKFTSLKQDYYLICQRSGLLLGCMTMKRYEEKPGGYLYISDLLVNPDYMTGSSKHKEISGIGRHLLRSAESICSQLHFGHVCLIPLKTSESYYLRNNYEFDDDEEITDEFSTCCMSKPSEKFESELVPIQTGFVHLSSDEKAAS
jgi:hypothetical protein